MWFLNWLLACVALVAGIAVIAAVAWVTWKLAELTYYTLQWVWYGSPLWTERKEQDEPWIWAVALVAALLLPITVLFLLIGIPVRLYVGRRETIGEYADKVIAAGGNVHDLHW